MGAGWRRWPQVARDWSYALPHWVGATWGGPRAVDLTDAGPSPCGVPLVILPGVWETWRFQLPLARALAAFGHAVHVLPELGSNGRGFAASARIVAAALERRGLDDVVIVAHSKGGLIAKQVLLDPQAGRRIRGVVAACTPFAGSPWARALPPRTALGAFSPRAAELRGLVSEESVNRLIVSLCPAWDQVVTRGCRLPGATNVALDVGGHFRPLVDPGVHALIHTYLHEFEKRHP